MSLWSFEEGSYLDSNWSAIATFIIVAIATTALVLYAVNAWIMGALYRKVGIAPWKAWVPVYQLWPFFELGGFRGGWSLLAIIPTLHSLVSFVALGQSSFSANFDQESGLPSISGFAVAIWGFFFLIGQLVPLLMTALGAIVAYRIGKVFGRDGVLCAVAYVLLPTVLFGLLGLGKSEANRETLRRIARPGLLDA